MTCTEPAATWPPKHPDEDLDYAVDFEQECARKWSPRTDVAEGTKIRVYTNDKSAGFEHEATTAGRTGGRMPHFATALNGTANDGSVVWTARTISSSSLRRTISGTPTWSATGLTIDDEDVSGTLSQANISGGEDGENYLVSVKATMSDGAEVVKVCVLPVRIPTSDC